MTKIISLKSEAWIFGHKHPQRNAGITLFLSRLTQAQMMGFLSVVPGDESFLQWADRYWDSLPLSLAKIHNRHQSRLLRLLTGWVADIRPLLSALSDYGVRNKHLGSASPKDLELRPQTNENEPIFKDCAFALTVLCRSPPPYLLHKNGDGGHLYLFFTFFMTKVTYWTLLRCLKSWDHYIRIRN